MNLDMTVIKDRSECRGCCSFWRAAKWVGGPEQGKLSSTEKIWRLLVRNVDDETEVLSLVRRGGEKRGCWFVMVRNVDNVA